MSRELWWPGAQSSWDVERGEPTRVPQAPCPGGGASSLPGLVENEASPRPTDAKSSAAMRPLAGTCAG